jgi:Fe-S cluster assembly ATP-binding protein
MKNTLLHINDLHVSIDDTPILKGLTLTINAGEVHAIMGPNGSGKSTLSKVLAGHPAYTVTSGEIFLNGENLLEMDPDERALAGIFLAFQYPVEIPGVSNAGFLRMSVNAKRKHAGEDELDPIEFESWIKDKLKLVDMNPDFLDRYVNHGFSGGEKKRNEILQMAALAPKLAILDEIDSGLDIDALRDVAKAVNALRSPDRAFLMITHYQRLLTDIVPDIVHIMANGRLITSGDKSLALKVEEKGYDWLLEKV